LAVKNAADKIRSQLCELARTVWPLQEEPIELIGGRAWCGNVSRSYAELMAARYGGSGGVLLGEATVSPAGTGSWAEGPVFWEVCIGAAKVEVDREIGAVSVKHTATVADVGRAINPQLVISQDEGSTMQGIGNALFEEMVFADGYLITDNLLQYRVPCVRDLPERGSCVIVENHDGPGPFGAKGCGEGSFAGIIAAVACAVADTGLNVRELPLTPERVWRLARETSAEQAASES
jgi:CO/xanthine dehydrogenase Mo-binding subunit